VREPYVDTYKYLGVDLNTNMDPSLQWQRVEKQICTLPHLLKRLKINGWSQPMLISAYRSYGLSHFVYSAAILMSCVKGDRSEMQHFQNRIFNIVGITSEQAAATHNIIPLSDRISDICERMFERIIKDNTHPITASLPYNEYREEFDVPHATGNRYLNSFLVSHLRWERDGGRNRYTNNNANSARKD
jgi:hypothetical protein